MGKHGTGKVLRTCRVCSVSFWARHDRPGWFCSRSCGSSAKPRRITQVDLNCQECGLRFRVKAYRQGTARFCSRMCHLKWLHSTYKGERHAGWKGGVTNRTSRSRTIIKAAKQSVGRCERCGSIGRLHGHHKEKWSDAPDLRECQSNIEILCDKCHAFEHPKLANMITYPPIRSGTMLDCMSCGTAFYAMPYKISTAKYCSRQCMYNFWRRAA